MAKKIKTLIKINVKGAEANPAPPIGTALGPHGLPIMEFVKAFNERTADQKGTVLPVLITVYEDRTFSFIIKKPPVAELIKMAVKLEKASGKPGRESAGKLTKAQVEEIAKTKMDDLNTKDVTAASKIVEGTARSMGIQVEQ